MESRQIKHFLCLCRTLNITRAAEESFITRQAFSASITKLEKEVGAALFNRGKLGVTPTEAGIILRDHLEAQMAERAEVLSLIRKTQRKRVLRIGITTMHFPAGKLKSLVSFERVAEGVSVQIVQSEEYGELLQRLRRDEIDLLFCLVDYDSGDDICWVEERCEESLVILMNSQHPLATRDSVDFENDMRGETLFCVSRDTINRLEAVRDRAGFDLAYVEPHFAFLVEKVALGDGLFLMPESLAKTVDNPDVTFRRCKENPIPCVAGFAHKKGAGQLVEAFIEHYLSSN